MPQLPDRPWRWLSVLALLASVVLTGIWLVRLSDGSFSTYYHIDTDVYRLGGAAFRHGDNLYTQDYLVGKYDDIRLPFTYPPLAALFFVPMTLLPLGGVAALLTLGSTVLLWWVLVVLLDALTGYSSQRIAAHWALCLLPLCLLFEPVRETLSFGQINILLMALVTTDALGRLPRWWPRGFLVGLAAAIKLTPAVFVVYFLARRQWRAAAVSVISAVVYTLVAAVISWENSWQYWTATLRDPGRIGSLRYPGNQSLRGLLARLSGEAAGSGGFWWLLFVGLVLVMVCAALWRLWALAGMTAAPLMLVLTSFIALLCSPVSWSHHWVWLAPAVIVLAAARTRLGWSLAGLLSASALLSLHWWLPRPESGDVAWSWWQAIAGNSYVLVAVLLIAVAIIAPRRLVLAQQA